MPSVAGAGVHRGMGTLPMRFTGEPARGQGRPCHAVAHGARGLSTRPCHPRLSDYVMPQLWAVKARQCRRHFAARIFFVSWWLQSPPLSPKAGLTRKTPRHKGAVGASAHGPRRSRGWGHGPRGQLVSPFRPRVRRYKGTNLAHSQGLCEIQGEGVRRVDS